MMVNEDRAPDALGVSSDATVCWECDTPIAVPNNVTLPLQSGQCVTLGLCAACYRDQYIRLLRELWGETAMAS